MNLDLVVPPTTADMAQASGLGKKAVRNWTKYCSACRRRYAVVRDIVVQRFKDDLRGRTFLDWGSALGAVAILMQDDHPVEMHAADVDPHSLAWLRKTNPDIRCTTLVPGKALPFEDGKFDCIYGISVLTHIPAELQEFYLGELRRIAKKDALVILTVKSYAACDWNRVKEKDPEIHPRDPEQLKAKGIIYHSYPDSVLGRMEFTKGGGYGVTYHSREYVREVFSRYFTIEAINEAAWGKQDAVVLRPLKPD